MRAMNLQGPARWTAQTFHGPSRWTAHPLPLSSYGEDTPVDTVTGGTVPAGQTYGPVAPPPESSMPKILTVTAAVSAAYLLWVWAK